MPTRPLASVLTLGCKLNLADSEEIARSLRAAGFDIVDSLCDADAYVINTCSITHVADRKSRQLIRSVRRIAPDAQIGVTGCFPQTATQEATLSLGADVVAGTRDNDKERLVGHLAATVRRRGPRGAAIVAHRGHTRAFIKAQEGCNDVCAFCVVPRTRGRESSRSIDAVVREVLHAVSSGAREVVVTGTQLGAWGRDLDTDARPHQLIAALLDQTDVARLRFSSLQPQDITPELLALWESPRLMPHFHLALQSGSDTILGAMRRRYDARAFLDAAERIKKAVRDVAITTDVIAGFPGESEDHFKDTLEVCRQVGFARIHAFPYSVRSGTTAARLPATAHVASDVTRDRMSRLTALGEDLSLAFRRSQSGTTRPVLWENEREIAGERLWSGHTDNYLPVFMAGDSLHNRITPVVLGDPYREGIRALATGGAI